MEHLNLSSKYSVRDAAVFVCICAYYQIVIRAGLQAARRFAGRTDVAVHGPHADRRLYQSQGSYGRSM
jgi:hypothetical protein